MLFWLATCTSKTCKGCRSGYHFGGATEPLELLLQEGLRTFPASRISRASGSSTWPETGVKQIAK